MKNATKTFIEIYKGMNSLTKTVFSYGTVFIVTLSICALYFYIQSTVSGADFYYTAITENIIICIKECMGSVYILPMLYEILSIIRKTG